MIKMLDFQRGSQQEDRSSANENPSMDEWAHFEGYKLKRRYKKGLRSCKDLEKDENRIV